ncbi:MAG: hypothetical protein ACKVWV_11625 [Planctomycetota bacterium]
MVSNLRKGDETASVERAIRTADGGLDIDLAHVMTVWGKQDVTLRLDPAELDRVLATPVDERTKPSDLTRLVLPRGRLIERDEEDCESDGEDAGSLPVDERTPAHWLDPLSAPSPHFSPRPSRGCASALGARRCIGIDRR